MARAGHYRRTHLGLDPRWQSADTLAMVRQVYASLADGEDLPRVLEDVARDFPAWIAAVQEALAVADEVNAAAGGGAGSDVSKPVEGAVMRRATVAAARDGVLGHLLEVARHLHAAQNGMALQSRSQGADLLARQWAQGRCQHHDQRGATQWSAEAVHGRPCDRWADPGRGGLCGACRQRRDRWRRQHGMATDG